MNANRHPAPSQSNVSRKRRVTGRDVYGLILLATMTVTGGALVATGCTFVNAFDDLKPHVPDTGIVPDTGGPGVDTGGTDTGTPPIDSGVDTPDTAVDPTKHGLVVVGGEVAADAGVQQVLSVLDPETGKELTRENMTVVNAMYDGNRDLWFIFENTTAADRVQPAPGDKVTLHVREWDYDAGKWKADVGTLTDMPTPYTRDAMAMLSEEIAYVAFTGGTTSGLVLLRTDTASKPVQVGTTVSLTGSFPIGVVGVRKTGTGGGGSVSILRFGTCTGSGTGCPIELTHYTAPATFDIPVLDTTLGTKVVATIDKIDSNPSFGTGTDVVNEVVIATPFATTADPHGSVQQLDPNTFNAIVPAIKFGMTESSKFLRAMAVDECDKVLFIPELLSSSMHVVPVDKPDVAINQPLGHLGQAVAWEPYTRSMIAPYKQGVDWSIFAWTVAVDGATKAATLTKRGDTEWKPPDDLRPNVVATKSPRGFTCK